MEVKELLQEAGQLEKKLKQMQTDVTSLEARKSNLNGDIQRLTSEKNTLSEAIADLSETVQEAVGRATQQEVARLNELIEEQGNEVQALKDEKSATLASHKEYIESKNQNDRAIKKNAGLAADLERSISEANAVKEKLSKVSELITEVIK